MAASLVGGAALGAPFGELLKVVIEEIKTIRSFKSSFRRLESTLQRLVPIVEEMDLWNLRLDRPEELKGLNELILEARELFQNCSKVSRFDLYSKARLPRKIRKIDSDLLRFCQMDMQVLQSRNQQETLFSMKSLSERIGSLSLNGNYNSGRGADFMELCSAPETESLTVGLDLPLKELKMRLFNHGQLVVVVSAPGGCGKTTLVKELCQDAEVKEKFKNIFFVTVSNTPDLRVMTQKLFRHNGFKVPVFVNDSEATNHLQKLIRQIGERNPILLVLDDVWHGSESVLEKFTVQLPDYKILVTSRFDFPNFGSPYRLKPLNEKDARDLLIHWSSPRNGSPYIRDKVLHEKILKHCKGFPLAIKVVGRSLSRPSLTGWKSQLVKWSEGESILETDQELLECLQTSLGALDTVLRQCFMDMGSFPDDKKIRASTIIDMWVELYGLDEDGVCAMGYLEELFHQNLLDLFSIGRDECEIDGFYNDYFATQHDILRELAIGPHQRHPEPIQERKRLNIEIKRNKFPEWLLKLGQPVNARLLSITTDESFSSRWFDIHCPEVEVLVLNFTSPNYVLPEFIARMEKLKVLVVTNYGFFPVHLGNFSVIGSLPNLKRIRLEKVLVASLHKILLQLRNLEKISLVMCNISEASHNIPIEISNLLPNLVEIDLDYCNSLKEIPSWVCEATKLRKLSITNCKLSKLPEAIGSLVNLEVLRLSSCIDLPELPGTIGRLCNLSYLDISDCMSLRRLPLQIGDLCGLKKLCMRKCANCELPPSSKNLEDVEVICDAETSFLWKRFKPNLENSMIKVAETEHNLNWLHKF